MKRLIVLAGLVLGLSLAVSAPGLAAGPPVPWLLPGFPDPVGGVQPPCADITDFPTGATFTGTLVTGTIGLAADSCPASSGIRYTMVVFTYGPLGFVSSVRWQTLTGTGEVDYPVVDGFSIATPASTYACVFFVTTHGLRVLDVAPDNGCPLRINLANPTATFNVLKANGDAAGGGGFH
jgi:hypothetical protein